MKWYKCFVAGENFPGILIDEDDGLSGFYTTRFVQANESKEAKMKILANLRHEESLKLPDGVLLSSEAKIYFEEIEEVLESDVPEIQVGFTFYAMGT